MVRPFLICFLYFLCALPLVSLQAQQPCFSGDCPSGERGYYKLSPNGKYMAKVRLTAAGTDVAVHEVNNMKTMARWNIPGFQVKKVEFSKQDPNQLLLTDDKKVKVFQISGGTPTLQLEKTTPEGQKLKHASFGSKAEDLLWATESSLFKTDLNRGGTKKIGEVDASQGAIQSVSSLKGGQYVVSQQGNDSISWFSTDSSLPAQKVKGTGAPIIGTASVDGLLLSVDEEHFLLSWDLVKRQITRRTPLNLEGTSLAAQAISLDEKGENLLVSQKTKSGARIQSYALADLEQGVVRPQPSAAFVTPNGDFYRSVASLLEGITDDIDLSDDDFDFNFQESPPSRVRAVRQPKSVAIEPKVTVVESDLPTGDYELALIEADNGDYDAALKFIRQVPTSDPDFRKSRILQRKIYKDIELQNSVNAAREQYHQGNFESARIILESVLDEDARHAEARRLQAQMDKPLTQKGLFFFLTSGGSLILLAGLGFMAWKNRESLQAWLEQKQRKSKNPTRLVKKKGKTSSKRTNTENEPEKEARNIRRHFILRFEETKLFLREAISKDKEGELKQKWMEFAARLKNIEQKAKQNPSLYPELTEQLVLLQKYITNLRNQWKKSSKEQKHSQEQDRGETGQSANQDKAREKKAAHHARSASGLDYYRILGVNDRSSRAEIKRAYRQRMQQYHPDKHNTSEFAWIKKEAERMTRSIQEAYDVLSDPKKSRIYQQNYQSQKRR